MKKKEKMYRMKFNADELSDLCLAVNYAICKNADNDDGEFKAKLRKSFYHLDTKFRKVCVINNLPPYEMQ